MSWGPCYYHLLNCQPGSAAALSSSLARTKRSTGPARRRAQRFHFEKLREENPSITEVPSHCVRSFAINPCHAGSIKNLSVVVTFVTDWLVRSRLLCRARHTLLPPQPHARVLTYNFRTPPHAAAGFFFRRQKSFRSCDISHRLTCASGVTTCAGHTHSSGTVGGSKCRTTKRQPSALQRLAAEPSSMSRRRKDDRDAPSRPLPATPQPASASTSQIPPACASP